MIEEKRLIVPMDTSSSDQSERTERTRERDREDDAFVPVILKRTDESRRHPDDVLQAAIETGVEQINRPTVSLALSSIAAGMMLGFTAMAVAIVSHGVAGVESDFLRRFAVALVYPLGFVICIMSGTELFTEHTATAVYPTLERRASVRSLLRLWIIVLAGNLTGALLSSFLLSLAEGVVQGHDGYALVGDHLTGYATHEIFISAVLAGWLMAQGAWLILATPPTLSQIVCIYIVTFCIGLGGLHHSIAGSVEMFTALLITDQFSWLQGARFIGLALAGNLVGGSLFVAVLNYGHIRETRATEKGA